MSLFQSLPKPDPSKTMLAYRVTYWPWKELSPAGRDMVRFNTPHYLPKAEVLASCNEELTKIMLNGRWYPIKWAWNNVPTELEWDKKSAGYLIRIELRGSPLIPDYFEALLSFELPSERELSLRNNH